MFHRKFGPVCLAIAIAALVSACGGSSGGHTTAGSTSNGIASKSPNQILLATKTAAYGLKSVHIYGSVMQDSKNVKLNLHLSGSSSGKGTIGLDGLNLQVVNLQNTFYMKAGAPFWSHFANAQAAQLLAGKWIKAPATGSFGAFKKFLNIHALFHQLVANKHKLTIIKQHSLNGQQVVGLHDQIKGGDLYVAATGKPYPIELTNNGKSAGTLHFNDFNAPESITAPKGAVSISQLQAQASSAAS